MRTDICVFSFSNREDLLAQDSHKILPENYRQTRSQKNQFAAVTHTGEILTRCSRTIATRRSPLKPHLHGRLLAARIDILPFFFLKSRRSLTRRKIHVRFCLRDIARHAPNKIKSQQSLTRKRFYRDACIRLQLAEVTYTLRLRASD